jgi:predicted DCC family thiol-disulfide oxidoreductase YuxK
MFLMFPWYLVFLPSFFIRGPLLWFTVFWWLLFLLLSHFVLNLSYLGIFEFLFFVALLYVPSRNVLKTVTFYYDGKCNLCARAVKAIRFLDITRRVRFITAQSARMELEKRGITQELALTQLAGLYKGETYIGYELYNLLAHKMPLLWWSVPLFYLGRIFSVGSKLYKNIADNRIKMFGSCPLPEKSFLTPMKINGNKYTNSINKAATTTICLFALIFLSNPPISPHADEYENVYGELYGSFYRAGNMLGIAAINVFNYHDLNMSKNWRVIEYCKTDENCEIVPLNNVHGDRLEYHISDTIYYGGTARWRRLNIEEDRLCDYGKEEFVSTEYINQIAMLYMRKNDLSEGTFKIKYFTNPLPDLTKDNWVNQYDNPKHTCTVKFYISKNGKAKELEKSFHD